jgi:hypothetical protein
MATEGQEARATMAATVAQALKTPVLAPAAVESVATAASEVAADWPAPPSAIRAPSALAAPGWVPEQH